ncbi:cysteine-rich repeat secretory protein 38-like [Prosopis cineraria]|uniref:cysteine-rich repeat secretory protein 38-like n=1 Tax=Prosopis cineraria TaxID=364024 RepID=UPI00241015D4|nr:cysteine-rich repeat secretory protein 38-like [Prosopis cineraria]
MTTSCVLISLALVWFLPNHLIILSAQPPPFVYHNCSLGKATYIKPSAYYTNLNALLSSFTLDTVIDYGFYSSSFGESPNKVHAQGLCRGDVEPYSCRKCLNDAKTLLPKLCPNQKDAFGYYDFCTFQYSSRSLLGIYRFPEFSYSFNNPQDAEDADKYTSALNDLMRSLQTKAAAGDSSFKLAVGYKIADEVETVYGLAQCSPDLSRKDCKACLEKAISEIPNCCEDKIGGRVIKLSCNLRFEKVHFYYD